MPADIATRALVVSLKAYGNLTTREIHDLTGLPIRSINFIYAKACRRGFDPTLRPAVIRNEFIRDAPRSGRPRKNKRAGEMVQEAVIDLDGDLEFHDEAVVTVTASTSNGGTPYES